MEHGKNGLLSAVITGSLILLHGVPCFLKKCCQIRSFCLDLRLFLRPVVNDSVNHAVIIFHRHLCILEIVFRKKYRHIGKANAVHVIAGYHAVVELITPIAIEKGLRFAIREGGRTVGSGVVIEIEQ